MEYFLVFLLGMALAVVIIFAARPSLFTRSKQDFTLFETMFEESVEELEKRQQAFLKEVEEKQANLLKLHQKLISAFAPAPTQSPKVFAVRQLAEKGCSTLAIAKKLGLGIGEVELILELDKDWETLAEND